MPNGPENSVQSNVADAFYGDADFLYTGPGVLQLGTAANPAQLLFTNPLGNTLTLLFDPDSDDNTFQFPAPEAGANYLLSTDGAGNTFWADPATLFDPAGSAAAAQAAAEAASDPVGSAAAAQAAAEAASEPVGTANTVVNTALATFAPGNPIGTPTVFGGAAGNPLEPWSTVSAGFAPFAAGNPSDWTGSPPSSLQTAVDRLAACLATAVTTGGLVTGPP
jgi:hypothetical protein